ncbi:Transposase IS4-like domain-containing protein [Stackebrandtia soli]
MACDGNGVPLAVLTTGANVNDVTCAIELVDAIPPIAGRPGRPRRRPDTVLADKGYDSRRVREAVQHRRITPIIPKRGTKGIIGLGKIRWVVERTISWLHQYKRLATRWEVHTDLHNGLISLACALIC